MLKILILIFILSYNAEVVAEVAPKNNETSLVTYLKFIVNKISGQNSKTNQNLSRALNIVDKWNQKKTNSSPSIEKKLIEDGVEFFSISIYSQDCFSGEVSLEKVIFIDESTAKKLPAPTKNTDLSKTVLMKTTVWSSLFDQLETFGDMHSVLGMANDSSENLVVVSWFEDERLRRIIAFDPWGSHCDRELQNINLTRLNFFFFLLANTDYSKHLFIPSSIKHSDNSYDYLIERLKKAEMHWFKAYSKLFPEDVQ